MSKKESRKKKERQRQRNLQKPARKQVRKIWGINPVDRIENPKKGRGSKYDRRQWQKEADEQK